MRTITFYSYKGGVGRTLAAANFAVYLARIGQKTVVVDFDLDAPGMDSKFPTVELPEDQRGLLDYILDYQRARRDPGRVKDISLPVPLADSGKTADLWLIPAGQYLFPDYYRKLDQLDWGALLSEKGEGVAFFEEFKARIEKEFEPDFVIVDSRTGICEISGLCTQQLADEVVVLSSLSAESIKMTGRIAQQIQESEIAKQLGKSISVKVVVSRLPQPDDLEALKRRCCELFGVEERALFFLFSCPRLEIDEFLAIAEPEEEEQLVSDYLRLFYGLNIELSSEAIEVMAKTTSAVLSVPPEEAERRITELATLYPHPEAHRAAMRFFRLVNNQKQMRAYGWRLLDAAPDDEEAQLLLAESYLKRDYLPASERARAVRAIRPLWQKKKLTPQQILRYADILEDADQWSQSCEMALGLVEQELLVEQDLGRARAIAARTAMRLGRRDVAERVIKDIPVDLLDPATAPIAVQLREEAGDAAGAFDLAVQVLRRAFSGGVLQGAARLADRLGRRAELEQAIEEGTDSETKAEPLFHEELRRCGLSGLADELKERARGLIPPYPRE